MMQEALDHSYNTARRVRSKYVHSSIGLVKILVFIVSVLKQSMIRMDSVMEETMEVKMKKRINYLKEQSTNRHSKLM